MFAIFKNTQNRDIEVSLDRMLSDCARMLGLASAAIFSDSPPGEVGEELWNLDKGVNKGERALRRELLVRGAVRHAEIEQGLLLAYMAVGKDIERIGDYCKNIWDLANAGVSFGGAVDEEDLRGHFADTLAALEDGRAAFLAQDERRVHKLIPQFEVQAALYDDLVLGLVRSEAPGTESVPRALYYRFLKRIVSHLANVLTSVVMPLDRIDYYKESKSTTTG